jgi:transposase
VIKIDKNINWLKIKEEYITSSISQRDLADKHGVSYNTLMKRATKEKWLELREKAEKKATEKLLQKQGDKLLSVYEKSLDLLEELLDSRPKGSGTKHVKKIRTKDVDGKWATVEDEWKTSDIVSLLNAVNNIQLNKDKLELEREKIDNNNW